MRVSLLATLGVAILLLAINAPLGNLTFLPIGVLGLAALVVLDDA